MKTNERKKGKENERKKKRKKWKWNKSTNKKEKENERKKKRNSEMSALVKKLNNRKKDMKIGKKKKKKKKRRVRKIKKDLEEASLNDRFTLFTHLTSKSVKTSAKSIIISEATIFQCINTCTSTLIIVRLISLSRSLCQIWLRSRLSIPQPVCIFKKRVKRRWDRRWSGSRRRKVLDECQ